jgi:hypothetical protein
MRKQFIIIFGFGFTFYSCVYKCTNSHNIKMSEGLLISAQNKEYEYCSDLNHFLNKDTTYIKKFSTYYLDGAYGYEHGEILIKSIQIIGEENFVNSIRNVTDEERELIKGYLDVGIEYGKGVSKQDLTYTYNFLAHSTAPSHEQKEKNVEKKNAYE